MSTSAEKPAAIVAFATGSDDLIPTLIERLREAFPKHQLFVVGEFPPAEGRWIPYRVGRTVRQNLARIRDSLRHVRVDYAALILQPRMPYWRMRATACLLTRRLLFFNENLDHFPLHPRGAVPAIRHFLWRAKNLIRWETKPGGWLYTQIWRLFHPWAYKRPLLNFAAVWAGRIAAWKKVAPLLTPTRTSNRPKPPGISVIIPSRDGLELLARSLPAVLQDLAGIDHEVIVVDNGSGDGTEQFLRQEFSSVLCLVDPQPLAFAVAVNKGIQTSRYSHVCLLNNDMVIEPGFFAALRNAFESVPKLFGATAQILFPPGQRREETGKAVMPPAPGRDHFPVACLEPLPREDYTYVLYGSGGCTLYDAGKLESMGGFDETFTPAYVEDLDLGYRGWLQGWPTVYVAGARVEHRHRSTTSRFYSPEDLQVAVETNYLRFLTRAVAGPGLFREMWQRAIARLNTIAAREPSPRWAMRALSAARQAPQWTLAKGTELDERLILGLGSGEVFVFPGRGPTGKPVILIASPYVPFPLSHGGAVRMYNLIRRASGDFDQVLVCFTEDPQTPAPEILDLCAELVLVRRRGTHLLPMTERPEVVEEFDSLAFHGALWAMREKWQPKLVQLEFTQLALYARECQPLPTILIEHDITLDLYNQLLEQGEEWELRQQYQRWVEFENEAWKTVSRVVTMSNKDRRMVKGGNPVVLPNGVDLERFQPNAEPPEPRRILFIGSFAHLPNLMAIEYFVRECWPALSAAGATLHVIAGANHRKYIDHYQERVKVELGAPGIEVEDFVSDVRPAYRRATVVIAPLLASAGTNIKILEAMAMGRAIVSTPAGINGLDLRDGADLMVVKDGAAMTAAILRLFEDPGLRQAIEKQARKTVEERYSWDAIAEKQKRLYEELIGRSG